MANDHMIQQLSVIEQYCEHVYAEKAQLQQQIAHTGGGSTSQQNLEIQRLQGTIATHDQIVQTLRAQILTMSSTSPDAVKKAIADNNALNAVVAQRDAEIQRVTAQLNHTVVENGQLKLNGEDCVNKFNDLLKNFYDPLVNDAKGYLLRIRTLEAEVTALQAGAPPPPAGGFVPAAYAPALYPPLNPATVPQQAAAVTPPAAPTTAAPVKQESGGGGGFMSRFGWRGGGTAPTAPAGGAPQGDAAAPPQPVQADPAARGRRAGGAGGAAAGGAVQGHVAAIASQFNVPPFADTMEMTITDMKRIFTVNPWNIDVDETSEITVFTSIITSDKYKSLVNQLASKYNIDANISEAEKIRLLTNVYKLTRYIFDLDKDAFKTFVDNNHIVLKKQHNSQLKTAAALKSKTRPDVLTILKLPEVVAALQAMN
jgi:hypothetical protein